MRSTRKCFTILLQRLSRRVQPLLCVFDCHNRGIMCSKNTRRSICAISVRRLAMRAPPPLYLGLTRYYNARASNNVIIHVSSQIVKVSGMAGRQLSLSLVSQQSEIKQQPAEMLAAETERHPRLLYKTWPCAYTLTAGA